jgi:hypothetical protein
MRMATGAPPTNNINAAKGIKTLRSGSVDKDDVWALIFYFLPNLLMKPNITISEKTVSPD